MQDLVNDAWVSAANDEAQAASTAHRQCLEDAVADLRVTTREVPLPAARLRALLARAR